MFGFVNIYKPKGKTSHDVVAILRRITKIKQIGHTGTLDPFAEGVLPICIGKATRLIEYLKDDKAYIGTVQLGESTTTYDIEGEPANKSEKKVSVCEIEEALKKFEGEIQQYPPIYSAIKIGGKKLYEYARKGETVEIKPRTIKINKITILEFEQDKQQLKLYIECSKGTYIRSIANDLGTELGTYGYLTQLIRTKAGDFDIKNSTNLDEINSAEDIQKILINPSEYLDYPKYDLNIEEKNRIVNGNSININAADGITLLLFDNKLLAVSDIRNNLAICKKVFL